MELTAFHGKEEIKAQYVARLAAHAAADEIVHGIGWEHGKGCAVGCTLHQYNHAAYETELGIPRVLAHLEDRIFEGLGNGSAKAFPGRFLSAIPVGADLSLVWPRFAVWLLIDEEHGVVRHTKKGSAQYVAIHRVAELYQRAIDGYDVAKSEFAAARTVAHQAYADVAAYAAADAAYHSARQAAREKSFKAQADKLVELLAQAPIRAAQSSEA